MMPKEGCFGVVRQGGQERAGRATIGMAIQEGGSVLSVLPFGCDLASPCRAPKSKLKTVWLGQPFTQSHTNKST